MKRITVKVGSNVLTRPDGGLDVTRMSAIVDQIAALRDKGHEVILVSSGAVASGRSMLSPSAPLDEVDSRQLFSAIGQARLMGRYLDLFSSHGIIVGQVLTMKEAFSSPEHYNNQKNCISVMLASGVLPIVNENDTISLSELMFTDNDELSGTIATMMDCDALVILSNIDGIYDGDPSDPRSRLVTEIDPAQDPSIYVRKEKSSAGRGGMGSKTKIAREVASRGIPVYIANGRRDNILPSLLEDDGNVPRTYFKPAT